MKLWKVALVALGVVLAGIALMNPPPRERSDLLDRARAGAVEIIADGVEKGIKRE